MADDQVERRESPFDAIRHEDEDGEHWYARELMPLAGYDQWRRFNDVIGRAMVSMAKEGTDTRRHFSQVTQLVDGGNLGQQKRLDFRLTRDACYLIAMCGDVRKKEIALAQRYFVVRTQEAEQTSPPAPPALGPMPSHVEALRGWADALEAQGRAEDDARRAWAEVEELRPPAEAWRALEASGGDCSIPEAARILNAVEGITTSPDRLSRWLVEIRLLNRRPSGTVTPYAEHTEHLRVIQSISGSVETRITPSGLSWILQRMRQEQNRPPLTLVPDRLADVLPIGRKS